MNSKELGAIAVGKAVEYFLGKGCAVFVPVTDTKRYDLVVDLDGALLKVEVKYTSVKSNATSYMVDLRATYHNNSIMEHRKVPHDFDLLFVLTEDGRKFAVRKERVGEQSTITVDKDFLI